MNYLKYIVGWNNIKINLKKIFLIFKWLILNNIKDIHFFLNFINFNKQFIKNYSKIIELLTKFMYKDLPFKWQKNQKQIFQKFKDLITEALIFQFYDPEKPIQIETDASRLTITECLI